MFEYLDKKRFHDKWKIALWICIGLSLVLFIVELSVHLDAKTHYILQLVEFGLLAFFAVDLGMHFFEAEDKKVFLKKNWYIFLLFLPFLRNLEILHGARVFAGLGEGTAVAAKGMFAGEEAMLIAARGMKIGTHIKREGFDNKRVKISRYISPTTDPDIAEGIKQGIDTYLRKKLKIKPKYEDKEWYDVFKIEQKHNVPIKSINGDTFFGELPEKSIVITDNKLRFQNPKISSISDLKKRFTFLGTTYGLDYENKMHIDSRYLRQLRGFITAYNSVAHSNEYLRCLHPNCVHSPLNNEKLDNLAFMFHLNRELPRCEKHQ